jgi:hypothetical protein
MPITGSNNQLLVTVGRTCRTVAVAIIAGFRRGQSFDEHETRIAALPVKEQVLLTSLVLSGLFACSLIAAQFGLIGLALFGLGVIFLIR